MAYTTFNLTVQTPEKELLKSDSVISVLVRTTSGEIQAFAGHENMVSVLDAGQAVIELLNEEGESEKKELVLGGGILSILDGNYKILADFAMTPDMSHEMIEEASEKASQLAQQIKSEVDADDMKDVQDLLLELESSKLNQALVAQKASKHWKKLPTT